MKQITTTFLLGFLFLYNIQAQPPANYYNNAVGKKCAAMKTALKTILNTNNNPRTYANLWTVYLTGDIKPRTVGVGSANVIYDIYSTNPLGTDPYQFTPNTDQCGTYSNEGDCYNREHSVPQSWFGGSTSPGPGTDYLHIFPTDGKVNGQRGNEVYGEVATANWTSLAGSKRGSSATAGITGTVFEPIDSFKGDVARAFLYFVTMYEDDMVSNAANAEAVRAFDANTFPSVKVNYLKLMIKWHKLDPVSAREKSRNNTSFSFQANRNPFVDRPDWVDSVWNGTCPGLGALPVDILAFSGKLLDNKIMLNWQVGPEQNVLQYEVEKSYNGTSYFKINTIEASYKDEYSTTDNTNESIGRRVFYRIKKVDKDGKYSYSNIFTLHVPNNLKCQVFPNPTSDVVSINLNSASSKTTEICITDLAGRKILNQNYNATNFQINCATIFNGTYILKVKNGVNEYVTKLVVVH